MNVLITGIHGFVGSNLVVFLEKYYTLYGLDIISSEKKGVLQIFSWQDIQPASFPFQTLPQFDAIIHLTGKAHDTKKQSAAQLAAAQRGVPVAEYTPMQVKQAVVGYGKAVKSQVMEMTRVLLNLKAVPKPDDTADALAVAICHAHSSGSLLQAAIARQGRR